jgi:hypothetical protein
VVLSYDTCNTPLRQAKGSKPLPILKTKTAGRMEQLHGKSLPFSKVKERKRSTPAVTPLWCLTSG